MYSKSTLNDGIGPYNLNTFFEIYQRGLLDRNVVIFVNTEVQTSDLMIFSGINIPSAVVSINI